MIRFSFIIPVYNAEKTIERCVKSIESNGCDDVEIILIEDCSSDGSLAVCKQLAQKYSNVICLNNTENKGVSYTRNRGLQQAVGQYLLFADSDDWIDNDYIDIFRKSADKYNADLTICGYVNHDERQNGRVDSCCWDDFDDIKVTDLKSQLKKLYDDRLLQQLWNKMFVAKYIKDGNIKFDESISIGEDTRFILSYLKYSNAKQVVMINKTPYHYMRDQDGSLMFNIGYESVEEPLKNLECLYQLMGYTEKQIQETIAKDREKQINLYAYLIMHNVGMKLKEKKKLVLALDSKNGSNLYKQNRNTYFKEQLAKRLKK